MAESILIRFTVILLVGTLCHIGAWHLHLPSIILLLTAGILLGPVSGFLMPDQLFGPLLLPLVAFSIALILFEGGLCLNLAELRSIGKPLRKLISIGALVTWILSTLGAQALLGLPGDLALLFGAILVVTGPTVVGPLVRFIRPVGNVGAILNWEGIVIDPIGATLAVLVFETLIKRDGTMTAIMIGGIVKTVLAGGLVGVAGAWLLVTVLRKYWIPDFLHNPTVLALVIGVYTLSNHVQTEAGLLGVTVLGILLANQKTVVIRHILEFKETLRVLLISTLFIVLTARVNPAAVVNLGWGGIGFLVFLIFVVRPLSVLISSFETNLSWRETIFLAGMAPRGVVAASVASIFALRLGAGGRPDAEILVPAMFLVIIGTVVFYSLVSKPLAGLLQVTRPPPTGFMIVGAHHLAREIGKALRDHGAEIALIDTNISSVELAVAEGLHARHANVLNEDVFDLVDTQNFGHFLALTPNDEVNALAVKEYVHLFGRARVYQVIPSERKDETSPAGFLQGRPLFGSGMTYDFLHECISSGCPVVYCSFQPTGPEKVFRNKRGNAVLPLFVSDREQRLQPVTDPRQDVPGKTRGICLVLAEPARGASQPSLETRGPRA